MTYRDSVSPALGKRKKYTYILYSAEYLHLYPVLSLHSIPAGELLLVQVNRNQNETPLLEPSNEAAWSGRRLVAVCTHRGAGSRRGGGHWRSHVRQGPVWYLLDSLPVGGERPEQSNPFLQQESYKICMLAFMWGTLWRHLVSVCMISVDLKTYVSGPSVLPPMDLFIRSLEKPSRETYLDSSLKKVDGYAEHIDWLILYINNKHFLSILKLIL